MSGWLRWQVMFSAVFLLGLNVRALRPSIFTSALSFWWAHCHCRSVSGEVHARLWLHIAIKCRVWIAEIRVVWLPAVLVKSRKPVIFTTYSNKFYWLFSWVFIEIIHPRSFVQNPLYLNKTWLALNASLSSNIVKVCIWLHLTLLLRGCIMCWWNYLANNYLEENGNTLSTFFRKGGLRCVQKTLWIAVTKELPGA